MRQDDGLDDKGEQVVRTVLEVTDGLGSRD